MRPECGKKKRWSTPFLKLKVIRYAMSSTAQIYPWKKTRFQGFFGIDLQRRMRSKLKVLLFGLILGEGFVVR